MSTHDATPAASSVRKVALASSLGATIEWYDFFTFGTASALVFNSNGATGATRVRSRGAQRRRLGSSAGTTGSTHFSCGESP
jgi:hypothetical protein